VPADGGRRGRRDNGLDAAAYVPLLDVDPRVGEHLLDVLGSAGVPAYLEPSADIEPYTRAYALPSPPTDRLYVDRERRSEARRIVDAETPDGPRPAPRRRDDEPSHGPSDAEEERAWQDIIAAFDAPSAPNRPLRRAALDTEADPAAAEPASPDDPGEPDLGAGSGGGGLSGGRHRARDEEEAGWADLPAWPADPEEERPRLPGRAPTGKDLDAAAAARQAAEEREAEQTAEGLEVDGPPELDEGHFEPPLPPPVPRPSKRTVVGLLLIALALLLFISPGVLGLTEGTGFTLGILSVLGGGVVLVLGLRDTRDDDGPDDGAVV
jgi:hypothetical protein